MPEDAINACTHVIKSRGLTDRTLAEAYNSRGATYGDRIFLEQIDATEEVLKGYEKHHKEDYDTPIEIDPSYSPAYYNRGLLFFNRKDYDHAIADLNEAIRLGPVRSRILAKPKKTKTCRLPNFTIGAASLISGKARMCLRM